MFSFFNRAQCAITSSTPAASQHLDTPHATGDVAHQLLERAEASAGRDPRHAQELRDAARAYLSVVR